MLLQVAAAQITGVDIVYHAFDESGVADVHSGLQTLDKIWQADLTLDTFVDRVVEQNFQWGSSNGT